MTTAPKKKRGRPSTRTAARRNEAPLDPHATLIKKYGNRRLYDTKRSRYVTLEELRDVIARGEEIQVVDETTGDDVTKRVMTQIILTEEESQHLNLLPVNFLKKLIQYRDESLRDYFQKYLSFSMDAYIQAQRMVEQRVGGALDAAVGGPAPGHPGAGQQALHAILNLPTAGLQQLMTLSGLSTPPAAPTTTTVPPPAPPPEADGMADEVAELRRRLAELEARYRR